MKKLFILQIVLLLALTTTGCGKKDKKNSNDNNGRQSNSVNDNSIRGAWLLQDNFGSSYGPTIFVFNNGSGSYSESGLSGEQLFSYSYSGNVLRLVPTAGGWIPYAGDWIIQSRSSNQMVAYLNGVNRFDNGLNNSRTFTLTRIDSGHLAAINKNSNLGFNSNYNHYDPRYGWVSASTPTTTGGCFNFCPSYNRTWRWNSNNNGSSFDWKAPILYAGALALLYNIAK